MGALTAGGEYSAESARPGIPASGCDTEIKQNFNCGAVQPMTEFELRTTAQRLVAQPLTFSAMLYAAKMFILQIAVVAAWVVFGVG